MNDIFPVQVKIGVDTLDNSPIVKRALNKLTERKERDNYKAHHSIKDDFLEKRTLYFLNFKGKFLKPCPGTSGYICCGYKILNIGTNCPMDCSYCILQSYFNQPGLRVFANLGEKLDEVLKEIDSNPEKIYRIGTGEFTDSLALDPLVGWTDLLVPEFSKRKNAILELKTKTTNIRGLIRQKNRDQIVISWSLNSTFVAANEEKGAAPLVERLKAARNCQEEGFAIGFHFDPLVYYDSWQEDYLRTIELMDKYVIPERIIWVSMGSFRYIPSLKPIIRKRHPKSLVLGGEFIQGLDGKMRYFKPIRVELYSFMREALEGWSKDLGIYLCMESSDVWQKSIGWNPRNSEGLSSYLDSRVIKIFG